MLRKFKIWLVRKLREFLGLGQAFVGVDWGLRDESAIVVVSRLDDGRVEIIDTRFSSAVELIKLIRWLRLRYGIQRGDIVMDVPRGFREDLQRYL